MADRSRISMNEIPKCPPGQMTKSVDIPPRGYTRHAYGSFRRENQTDHEDSQMKVAIGTTICFAATVVLLLVAIIHSQPNCGDFTYEFEFRSPATARHCILPASSWPNLEGQTASWPNLEGQTASVQAGL
jgi:hypothetical protein